jgi:hypothetical protein
MPVSTVSYFCLILILCNSSVPNTVHIRTGTRDTTTYMQKKEEESLVGTYVLNMTSAIPGIWTRTPRVPPPPPGSLGSYDAEFRLGL